LGEEKDGFPHPVQKALGSSERCCKKERIREWEKGEGLARALL